MNCIPDGVTSSETDPLWNWSVLLLCLCKLLLGSETLVALFNDVHVSPNSSLLLNFLQYPSAPLRIHPRRHPFFRKDPRLLLHLLLFAISMTFADMISSIRE